MQRLKHIQIITPGQSYWLSNPDMDINFLSGKRAFS